MKKAKLRKKAKRYIQVKSDEPNVFLDLFNRMYIDWAEKRDSEQARDYKSAC